VTAQCNIMLLFFCNLQCHFMPLQRELYVSIQVSLLVIKYTGSATWLLTGRDGVLGTVLDLEEVEDSSRTKRCGFGLGLRLGASIFLLSIVFTVAVRVTRTVQGSRFTRLTLRSQLCEERWLNVED